MGRGQHRGHLRGARRARRLSRPTVPPAPIEARLAAAGLPPLPRTAWAEIDLDALVHNLRVLRSLVEPGVRVEPVVKADAYGHGAVPVARALEAAAVDGLSVATWDEALELRGGGIRTPLLVLYAIPAEAAPEAARRGIAASVGDAAYADRLIAALAQARVGVRGGRPASRRVLRVHVAVETGLGRDGVAVSDVAAVVARLQAAPGIRVAGLWTHLQEPEDEPLTLRQEARLEAAAATLRAAGLPVPDRHISASGDLLHPPFPIAEAIRPGLLLYGLGLDPLPVDPDGRPLAPPRVVPPVRPVLALRARPVRVADVPAGWGISYGPSFVTARPSRIATLPLGYADGWPRALSNRARVLVRGVYAPVVGNVAMDAIMVDVTDVPGPPVTTDDEVTLIGRQGDQEITANDLAQARTTISREATTAFSRRLPRVYHAAAGISGVRTLVSEGRRA